MHLLPIVLARLYAKMGIVNKRDVNKRYNRGYMGVGVFKPSLRGL
jgi:hypothetical protein